VGSVLLVQDKSIEYLRVHLCLSCSFVFSDGVALFEVPQASAFVSV